MFDGLQQQQSDSPVTFAEPGFTRANDAPQPGGETVSSAAVLIEGRVFTGALHADAIEAAARQLKMTVDQLLDKFPRAGTEFAARFPESQFSVDGFVTSTGRYVGRAEADQIATGRRDGHLMAEDLSPQPRTARQQTA